MTTIDNLEQRAWKLIDEANQRRDPRAIAYYGMIAQEIEEKKKDWTQRLTGAPENGAAENAHLTQPSKVVFRRHLGRSGRGSANSAATSQDFTGKPVRAFVLAGERHPVSSYKELLLSLLNLLRQKHSPERFDGAVLNFGGRKRRYFSKDPRALKYAEELIGGGLFVETNLDSNRIVNRICVPLVDQLEEQSDFRVETGLELTSIG